MLKTEHALFLYGFMKRLLSLIVFVGVLTGKVLCQIVCIDPGHPSENGVGTRGKQISELEACWKVAVELRQLLQSKGFQVVMTKSSRDQKVTNRQRAQIANSANANLMLRLHCDAATESGFASYYPAKAGKVGGAVGPSKEVIAASRKAAQRFHPAAVGVLKGHLKDRRLRTDSQTAIGARQGALTGSIYARVPVILVEMCVLQSKHDEAFIRTPQGQAKMAEALCAGVVAALRQGN